MMTSKNLYQPVEVLQIDLKCWEELPDVYHFFEIIQVCEGAGIRYVNSNRFSYKKGSIFLFTPQDCRSFDIGTPTRFCSIRFSAEFFSNSQTKEEKLRLQQWLKRLEYIFSNHNRQSCMLIKDDQDCSMVSSLISYIVSEYQHKKPFYEDNLKHSITLLLNLMSRNVTESLTTVPVPAEEDVPMISRIGNYIRQHIYQPELLKLMNLAAQFNLSATYIGEYFKKQTGESLQQYIMRYKLNLVQTRLESGETHKKLVIKSVS